MKKGSLVRYRRNILHRQGIAWNEKIYIVERVETKNEWIFVYGQECPIQMDLMEVVSESR